MNIRKLKQLKNEREKEKYVDQLCLYQIHLVMKKIDLNRDNNHIVSNMPKQIHKMLVELHKV